MRTILELLRFVPASTEALAFAKGGRYLAKSWDEMNRVNKQLLYGRTDTSLSGS